MSEEQLEIFGPDAEGLKQAASARIEQRQETGAPETPTLHTSDGETANSEIKLGDDAPEAMSVRNAGRALQSARNPGDEAFQEAMGEQQRLREMFENDDELRERVVAGAEQSQRAAEEMDKTREQAEAELARLQTERDAAIQRAENVRAEAAQRQQVQQSASQIEQYKNAVYSSYLSEYPEAAEYLVRGDQSKMVDLAHYNPVRFREAVQAAQLADNIVIGAAVQTQAQNQQYLNQQVAQVVQSNSEYQGDSGRQRMAQHADAAIKARMAKGFSQAEIQADLTNPANYSRQNIEAFLAEGREYAAKEGIKSKRYVRPVTVQRPGVAGEAPTRAQSELANLSAKFARSENARDAARFLAAQRRADTRR